MGAIADAIVEYARPLIDATDGSHEQLENALAISQFCFNLAVSPEGRREETLRELRSTMQMDDEEYAAFRQDIVIPMLRRHEEMFPRLHRNSASDLWQDGAWMPASPPQAAPTEKYPGTDRYAPCPCNSGRKYKFCCGATRR